MKFLKSLFGLRAKLASAMELFKKQLGPETFVEIDVTGGNLIMTFTHQGASGQESFQVQESLKYFIDKEKGKLPAWAQGIIDIGEAAIP